MNSVLQALYHVPQFSLAITLGAYPFQTESTGEAVQTLFEDMQQESLQGRPSVISPQPLVSKLGIDIHYQEDAEELMLRIINGLDESIIAPTSAGAGAGAGEDSLLNNGIGADKAMKAKKKKLKIDEDLLPSSSIRLELKQTIRCINKNNHISSEKVSTHFDLSLAFKGMSSLQQAVANYFAPEMLIGEHQYKCSEHGLQDAERHTTISRYPQVLAVHLQRFWFDEVLGRFNKITDKLDIPLTLDLSPYSLDRVQTSDKVYELSAVVVHDGTLERGHYFTYAKVPSIIESEDGVLAALNGSSSSNEGNKKKWVELNDQRVKEVDEATVLRVAAGEDNSNMNKIQSVAQSFIKRSYSTNAYLLFYTLQD